ncbi:MAG: hypothetical protein R3F20_02125 [Planctomycetota bacterium]
MSFMNLRGCGSRTVGGLLGLALTLVLVASTTSKAQATNLPIEFTILAPNNATTLGSAVTPAGDVNNDGFPDVIVASSFPSMLISPSASVSLALIVSGLDGSVIRTHSVSGLEDRFGESSVGLGDINGDGFDDYVIAARLADFAGQNTGRVVAYSGFDGAVITTMDGTGIGDELGSSLASAGDIDGDGIQDLIIGARADDDGGVQSGSVFVLSGASGAILHHFIGNPGDEIGWSVAGPGDVNGDGVPDIVTGSPYSDVPVFNAGDVRVYSGLDGSLIHVFVGVASDQGWGATVAGAGDVNGDGFADIIASAAKMPNVLNPSPGRVAVYSGADGALIFQDSSGGAVGFAIAGGCDFDGDGHDDFGFSARNDNTVELGAGRFDVYSGFDQTLLIRQYGLIPDQHFGRSFAFPGDLNGDGHPEIAAGSKYLYAPDRGLGGAEFFSSPLPPFTGSNSDLRLWTGVNGPAILYPYIKTANEGDILTARLFSLNGYVGEISFLAAQIRVTGTQIAQPMGFPESWVNPSPFSPSPVAVLQPAGPGSVSPSPLPATGLDFSYGLPVGLSGFTVMLQGFALAPNAETGNTIFTATDGCEIEVQ